LKFFEEFRILGNSNDSIQLLSLLNVIVWMT